MTSIVLPETADDKEALEEGAVFAPRFDANGLVTAVVTDAGDGMLLMVAHMNAEALALTLETGIAHYWSRSRGALWKKGETSGNFQQVVEMRTDCDQDAIWLRVKVAGHDATCHTGRRSCFYRTVVAGRRQDRSRRRWQRSHCSMQKTLSIQLDEPFAILQTTQIHHFDTARRVIWAWDKGDHDARLGVIAQQARCAGSRTASLRPAARPMPKPAKKSGISLALGGGAARGWAHIGVLRALDEAGIEIDMIAGTSIGALVGGCYLAGKLDELEEFARSLTKRRIFGLLDLHLRRQRPVRRHEARRSACSEHMNGLTVRGSAEAVRLRRLRNPHRP